MISLTAAVVGSAAVVDSVAAPDVDFVDRVGLLLVVLLLVLRVLLGVVERVDLVRL